MRVSLLFVLLGAVACSGGQDTDSSDTDPDTGLADCVQAVGTMDAELSGPGRVEETFTVQNLCAVDIEIDRVELRDLAPEFELFGGPGVVASGGELELQVSHEPSEPGVASETLEVDVVGFQTLSFELRVRTLGARFTAWLEPQTVVRSCPTDVAAMIQNDGEGAGRIDALSVTFGDVPAEITPSPPIEAPLGSKLRVLAPVVLQTESMDVRIDLAEGLGQDLRETLQLAANTETERTMLLEPWTDGRPIDVLLTLDRERPRLQLDTIRGGLEDMFRAMESADLDYRAVGLLRDTGCPLSTTVAKTADGARSAAETVVAQLDLSRSRVGETGIEDRPFELVGVALADVNTQDGGCNAWRRPDAALLTIHVAHRDDGSTVKVADHVAALQALVPHPDHLMVASVAPPAPDGCVELELDPAFRLDDAATRTGAAFVAACSSDMSAAFGGLVRSPGEENLVRLPETPYPPSVQAWVDGVLTEVTVDGDVVTLPRRVDRLRDAVEIRYVPADACPGR